MDAPERRLSWSALTLAAAVGVGLSGGYGCGAGPTPVYTEGGSGSSGGAGGPNDLYTGQHLEDGEIASHGTVNLRSAPERVFRVSIEAARAAGYEIESVRARSWTVVTRPKLAAAMIYLRGSPARVAGVLGYGIALTIQVQSNGRGGTRVVVTPSMFENGRDVSEQNVWNYDAPGGMHEVWAAFFARLLPLL